MSTELFNKMDEAAAVRALEDAGVPENVIKLLTEGDSKKHVPPGALQKVIQVLRVYGHKPMRAPAHLADDPPSLRPGSLTRVRSTNEAF